MFKRLIPLAVLILSCSRPVSDDLLIRETHPRLFATEDEIARIRRDVEDGGNTCLVRMHESVMSMADEASSKDVLYGWEMDAAGKRLPSIYNSAKEIVACTYAYRMTSEPRYLSRVEALLDDVCALPGWNPSHFLDVAQGAIASAMAYDWLFDSLSEERKSRILDCLYSNVIEAASDPRYELYLRKLNNWNQVCNGGVVLASICLWDRDSVMARKELLAAIERNHLALDGMFAPDGIYPEGPGYMGFGCGWQIMIISALESAFGTDLGLSGAEGFLKAPYFRLFCHGPSDKQYNFSDNGDGDMGAPMMWFFADKLKDNSLLYYETLPGGNSSQANALLLKAFGVLDPVYIIYADRFGGNAAPQPSSRVFAGRGIQPLVIARTGWGVEDLYLGLKGGNPTNGHAHMDCGSFVFDAYGYRWAADLSKGEYTHYESNFDSTRDLWKKTADSPRWRLFAYNNRQHNTITINDKDHSVTGYAALLDVVDTPDAVGGTVDINNCFGGMTYRALRTALIRDDSYLEVTDDILASEDDECLVRWTMATEADVEVVDDGIILRQGGISMKLQAEGADVLYRTWPCDPAAYPDNPYHSWDKKQDGFHLCGYTFLLPKAGRRVVKVTLKRI